MVIQSLTISKKRKEMKKIFYILAAAIVALGTVACENEGLDNINPNINVDGDTVSFVAGINRTDLNGTATVWDADDTIVVTWNGNNYEFKNAETGDENTFKCTAEGLSAIVNAESIKAVYSNNKDGNVDSAAGVAGALLEYEGAFGDIAFEVKNAFLKFTANAGSEVKFTASAEIFSTGTELTLTATGEDQYVAVIPKTTTITYALDGVVCTTSEENTLKACKIYPLSTLNKVVVIKTKEDFLNFAEAVNNGTSYEGYTVKLNNNIDLEDAANTLSIVVKNNNITLDLNGKTLTANNTRTATHNFFFDVNAGGVLTVENGSIVYTHTGTNMGWNGAATAFDVTGGGVLNMNGVNVTVSGTDMNFCVHLNNWGEVTFNADGCKFNATYCGVRVFNSGYDMNNVTIKNSHMTGATRAFWVQMYIGDSLSKPETHPNDARKARLNFDIFGNNNTYALSGEATSPVRYGQTASIYFNPENGNQVLGNATDLSRFAKYVNEGIENYKGKTVELVKDIELDGAEWTPVGSIKGGVNKSFRGTFEGNDKIISNFKVNATEGAGFFGAKWDGDIKNVKFNEATITGNHYAGVIVGWADGANYNYNWTVSGCEVDNSTVTIAPELIGEKYDNGDKAGALVGYAYGINVKENTVANTTIQGYRDLGGLVGIAQENTKTTPHSEWAVVTNNSLGEGVKIIVDNNHNYQEYDIQSQYNVQSYVGRISDCSVVENNNGDATIVWGDIPATLVNYVAQVGEDKYETFEAALEVAEAGSTIELLDNIDGEYTIEKACTIDTKGFAFNYTVATGFRATKNENIITVVKLEASVWTIIGDHNSWTEGDTETVMYKTSTDNVFVAYNVTFSDTTKAQGDSKDYNEFKIRQNKAWTTSYGVGACAKAGYKVKLRANYRNTGIEENGTYDIYFNLSTKEIAVMPVGETWSDAVEPKFNDGNATCTWGIAGSMTGWNAPDIAMYWDGTYWYAKGVQFEKNDTFKCRQNGAWDWQYGNNNKQSATSIGNDGDNIKATAKCCYDVYVSKTQHKVWFKAAGQRP